MQQTFRAPPHDHHEFIYSGYATTMTQDIDDANALVTRLTSGDERLVKKHPGFHYYCERDYDAAFLNYDNIVVAQHHDGLASIYIAMNVHFDWYTHIREWTYAGSGFELVFNMRTTNMRRSNRFLLIPPRRQLVFKTETTRLHSLLLLITAFSKLPGTIGCELLAFNKRIFSYLQ